MKDDSKCPKKTYCQFEVSRSLPRVQIEVCVNCGKKVVYNKDPRGRVDKSKYLRDHIRDTVQPYGKTERLFFEIYGEKIFLEFQRKIAKKKTKAEIQAEWEQMRRDIRRRAARNSIYI